MRALLAAIECQKGEIDRNLDTHLTLLRQAAATGCDLVLFPEMSLTGSADPWPGRGLLISLDHPAVAAMSEATDGLGTAACFGIAERTPAGTPHITQVIAADGQLLGIQRKRHLGEGEEEFMAATGATIVPGPAPDSVSPSAPRRGMTTRSTTPPRAAPGSSCSPQPQGSTGAAPAQRPGDPASRGGKDAASATRSGTRAGGGCGSRSPARRAPRSTRTFPG